MLKKLMEEVFQSNLDLVKHGLVIFTWGNVSGIDREKRFAGLNAEYTPGVLVNNHSPFAWGKDTHSALHNAVALEQVAKMAHTERYQETLQASKGAYIVQETADYDVILLASGSDLVGSAGKVWE